MVSCFPSLLLFLLNHGLVVEGSPASPEDGACVTENPGIKPRNTNVSVKRQAFFVAVLDAWGIIPPNVHTSYHFRAVYIDQKYTYLFYSCILSIILFGDCCKLFSLLK